MGVRLAHAGFESDDPDVTDAFYNVLGIKKRFEFRYLQDELVARRGPVTSALCQTHHRT